MKTLHYFAAGFLSTIIVHQGLLHLFFIANISPVDGFSFKATAPLGIPALLSLSFFGGLWGIALGFFLNVTTEIHYWLKAFLFGAFFPTLVALAIVFPIKNISVSSSKILLGLTLNGAWGLGSACYIFFLRKYPLINKGHIAT